MEENKPQEMEQSSDSSLKTNGETKLEEQLDDFVTLDDVGSKKVADKENPTAIKDSTGENKNEDTKQKPSETVIDTKNDTVEAAPDTNENNETVKTETSVKDQSVVHDSEKNGDALILTADEDLEPATSSPKKTIIDGVSEVEESNPTTAESSAPNAETPDDSKTSTDAPPVSKQRAIWVSNISKTIKATDLKQYLSKAGKVNTAKVVTDGKRCFGYVVMENAADASECVKTLSDTNFDGKTIVLSFEKPTKVNPSKPSESQSKKVSRGSGSRSSNAKRGEKRPRAPSKTKSDKDKNTTETKAKTENSPSGADKPPEKKAKSRSRSRDRYLRERSEQDRLRRRLVEEDRRNREARKRQVEIEERQREKEFKLDQERRKLQLEREIFEKQKKEWARINEERRKLEKARLEIEQQRTKLEEDLKKERMKRKSPEIMPSVVSKISDPSKKGMKNMGLYNGPAPPPPKLGSDYMIGGRKSEDLKLSRGGGRKMEIVDRKFYAESTDRKKHYVRKPEFEENKSYVKRYPGDREAEHRTQWSPPVTYNAGVGSSSQRYQETIPPPQYGGAPPQRVSSYYYHAPGTTPEFSRYDHVSNRKY